MTGLLDIARQAEQAQLARDAQSFQRGLLDEERAKQYGRIRMPTRGENIAEGFHKLTGYDYYGDQSALEKTMLGAEWFTPIPKAGVLGKAAFAPMAGITAFHGSPHIFNKFRMDKIGTGEGAQAYGHGLYLAENPQTAKQYRDAFSSRLDAEISGGEGKTKIPQWLAYSIAKGDTTIDDAIADWASRAKNQRDLSKLEQNIQPWQNVENAVRMEKTLGELQKIKSSGGHLLNRMNHLYKVDLPDESIAKMLDWDKPLSEQGEKIHKVWEKFLGSGVGKRSKKSLGSGNFNQPTGEDFHNLIYEGMPRAKGQTHGGGATFQEGVMAADWLKRQGIPGIKYLDQGSRGAGQGTRNFVVFDENIPKILERNQQPIGGLLGK